MAVSPALLSRLEEMLLISYDFDESADRFVLVTDFPERSDGSDRDFLRVICSGVHELTRYRGVRPESSTFGHHYQQRNVVGSYVVQRADLTGENGDWQLHLDFGNSFGALHLRCTQISATRRGSIGRRTESGAYEYYSVDGDPLDFYAPFADVPPM